MSGSGGTLTIRASEVVSSGTPCTHSRQAWSTSAERAMGKIRLPA